MIKADLKDIAARRAIVEELESCMLVEAGAGSGKTYSLVQRMVALIREGKCTVDKLAAVTFTRKAAAELKGRFQLELEKALSQEGVPEKKERLVGALDGLDRCFLGTIHSFCACLLRERPVEAGLDPDFIELEKLEDKLLQQKAWEDYLLNVQSEAPHLLESLLKIDIDVRDLKSCYSMLLNYPDVKVVREDAIVPDLAPVRQELNKLLDWAENLLPDIVPEKGWDTLQEMLRKALRWRKFMGLSNDLVLLRLLASLDKVPDITQNRWRKNEDAKTAENVFTGFRENYIRPALRGWREHRHAQLVDFVLPAVELYEQRKGERSKLNFQDLLMKTASLLKNNPEVRLYFQRRYSHLLVDEFQDTDPIQAELMFYLAGSDVSEQDWRKLEPRPGAMFVVGDPKQSIYRFRRADIDTYNEVKSLLADGGGRVEHLTTNFRSVQAIGDFVNTAFKEYFPEEASAFQAAFASLDTVRPDEQERACGVRHITIPKVYKNSQRSIVSLDAERIARWICWAIDGGISLSRTREELEAGLTQSPIPGDFMILLRYKECLEEYARALEKHGIPFQIAGSKGHARSAEMAGVINVLKSLLDPDDPVLLAAVLRGRLFGISDKQLWRFKQEGGRFNFLSEVPGGLGPEDKEIFQWAFDQLRAFRKLIGRLPASAALINIMKELGAIPYALTGKLGKSRSGHLLQSLELAAAAEGRGITTFSGLVDYLELIMEAEVEEELNITPGEGSSVRLMNLHKAKGLEAPVVFLANPGKNSSYNASYHINRTGDKPRGYFLINKKINYQNEILGQPLNWDSYAGVEGQYLSAEEDRLLYVAATRAKNLLVVSTYPEKPVASPWHLLNGHLSCATELEDIEAKPEKAVCLCHSDVILTGEDLARAREGFISFQSPLCAPSYSVASVTSLVKASGEGPARKAKATGRGQSWGRVVHRVMEACAKKSLANLDRFIENVLAEEGRATEEKEQVLKRVNEILESPLWQRMLASRKRFMEVPFSVKAGAGEWGFTNDDVISDDVIYGEDEPVIITGDKVISGAGVPANIGHIVISGAIDLVFLEEDGWVIADYKTDTVENEEELKELVKYYTPQVEMYRKFWEGMAKTKVKEAGLYFTYLNRWVVV